MALLRTELDRLDPSVTTDAFVSKGMDKDGDLLVIGSKIGEVYIYQHDAAGSGIEDDTWTKIATLNMPSGQQADSVAIHANKIVAGGAGGADGVALWLEPSGGWVDKATGLEDAYLTALNGDPIGQTPESIVIHEESVIASYPGLNSPTAPHGGRAYVYGQTTPDDADFDPDGFVNAYPGRANTNRGSQALLDTDKVVIFCSVFNGVTWNQEARVGDLSGSGITYGSGVTARTGNISPFVVALDPTTAVLVTQGFSPGKARVATVSGLTMTMGAEFEYDSAGTNFMTAHKVDSTRFAVTYQDGGVRYLPSVTVWHML